MKPPKSLLDRLRRAAARRMTADEIRRQRISFVYGNLPDESTMTPEEVAVALARLDGAA